MADLAAARYPFDWTVSRSVSYWEVASTDPNQADDSADGASTRDRILDAALLAFSRRGYGETSVASLARDAEVSKGLVYHYFDTKRDVLEAVVRRGGDRVERALRSAASRPPEAPAALVMEILGVVAEELPWWRLYFRLRTQPEARGELGVGTWETGLEETLERSLRRAGVEGPDREARALAAAVEGAAQRYVLDPDGYPVVEVAETMVARYLPSG